MALIISLAHTLPGDCTALDDLTAAARAMKTLTSSQRQDVIGEYFSPRGYYEWSKALPFLGTVESNVEKIVAGEWTEIVLTYTVGSSGLADGAWIKGTFKFYSVSSL